MTMTDIGADSAEVTIGDIVLRLPVSPPRTHVVRALVANVAMHEDYNVDEISDLRLAVDEVCSTAISLSKPDGDLSCTLRVASHEIEFRAEVQTSLTETPDLHSTFGWRILLTLADTADLTLVGDPTSADGRLLRIQINKRRGPV